MPQVAALRPFVIEGVTYAKNDLITFNDARVSDLLVGRKDVAGDAVSIAAATAAGGAVKTHVAVSRKISTGDTPVMDRSSATAVPVDPLTLQPVGGGTGTGFTYDATLQAAKATVDGVEVLALKRQGDAALATIVPTSGNLLDLLALRGPMGTYAWATDHGVMVAYQGPDTPAYALANGKTWVVDVNTQPDDAVNGFIQVAVPAGYTNIILSAALNGGELLPGRSSVFFIQFYSAQVHQINVFFGFDTALEATAGRFDGLAFAAGQSSGPVISLKTNSTKCWAQTFFASNNTNVTDAIGDPLNGGRLWTTTNPVVV